MSNATNGKTYTEVVLEFTQMLSASEHRQTVHNGEVIARLEKGDAKFAAIYDKLDGEGGVNERIKDNATDIKANEGNITKVRNLNATLAAFFSGIAALVGWNR